MSSISAREILVGTFFRTNFSSSGVIQPSSSLLNTRKHSYNAPDQQAFFSTQPTSHLVLSLQVRLAILLQEYFTKLGEAEVARVEIIDYFIHFDL